MIVIEHEQPLHLTQTELNRLRAEYQRAYSFYSGEPPAFEDWVRAKLEQPAKGEKWWH